MKIFIKKYYFKHIFIEFGIFLYDILFVQWDINRILNFIILWSIFFIFIE